MALVWFDNNNDGIYDEAQENPIPGVTLALLDGAGMPVDDPNQAGFQPYVTTTNSTGDYLFENLPEGTYQIQIGASNFSGPGALVNTISSTPTDAADNQTENNDNG
ncbi:MAG: carboxypeptidase regulatory-like domain-containing protein, partial [Saprospiraceae bacterium]|nr:carboxypeptidase regulatory-like domain-containing protein [Saprospiraceae bacterium]